MPDFDQDVGATVIPIAEERLRVGKRTVETGRVEVQLRTEQDVVRVHGDLESHVVSIERVPVEQLVDQPPEVRQDGDVTIVPVVEEVMVKRFFIREEVRITRTKEISSFNEDVTLRRQQATVERAATEHLPPSAQPDPPSGPELPLKGL